MNVLTISPYMEDFVQATILDAPVTNQLGVGGTQVNLLIGQFKESGVLFWVNAVGPKLIKRGVFLLRPRGEVHTRLQTGSETSSRSASDQRTTVDTRGPEKITMIYTISLYADVSLWLSVQKFASVMHSCLVNLLMEFKELQFSCYA